MTRLLLIATMLLVSLGSVTAGEKYTHASHKMSVDGTSTLHDWTSDVEKVKVSADLAVENGELTEVKAMWVQIDAMSIKSEKGEDMDEKIYEALKTEDGHKTITFNMSNVKSIKKEGDAYKVTADGSMTIAGHKKNVTMDATAKVMPDGTVQFNGAQKFIMTEYDMERPSAMLGMIKAGDEVTVNYTVTVKKAG